MFGRKNNDANRAMSAGKDSRQGCARVVSVLFFGVFFAAGCAVLYFFAFKPLWGVYSARSWHATPCNIVSSRLEENDGDDGSTYRIDIRFRYRFGDREYQSKQYKFFNTSSNVGVAGKRAIVRNHPPGKQTTCFVNPHAPAEAVIERGLTWDMLWGFFGVPFFLVGAIGLAATLGLIKWKTKAPGQADWMPTVKHRRHVSEWSDDDEVPVTLRPKMGPVGKLLLMLLFAGVWNGIVSVLIFKTVEGIQRGRTEWILVAFAVVFGGVGLILIGAVFHAVLGLFTPRPILVVNSAQLPLGEILKLTWRFRGQTGSLRRLHIYLEGQEEATYRRGTDTYTDKETFATLALIDTTDPLEMPSGETQLSIPTDTMHSFDADHNDISWTLHVKGEIARWPDVAEEYPLLIVPPGMPDAAEEKRD